MHSSLIAKQLAESSGAAVPEELVKKVLEYHGFLVIYYGGQVFYEQNLEGVRKLTNGRDCTDFAVLNVDNITGTFGW